MELITCRCWRCNGNIEFDADELGPAGYSLIQCPHCGKDVTVQRPEIRQSVPEEIKTLPPPKIPAPANANSFRELWQVVVGLMIGGSFIAGGFLVLEGFAAEPKSAMQQTVCTIQYCSGLLLIVAGAILHALAVIAMKFK